MKKRLITIFAAVLILLIGCVKDPAKLGIHPNTIYKGRVIEKSQNKPIKGVTVSVTDGSHVHVSQVTGDDGRFEFRVDFDAIDDQYSLQLDCQGYTSVKEDLKGFGQESYDYRDIVYYDNNDPNNWPNVTTAEVLDITSTTARVGGTITYSGAAAITARGVCWGVVHNPSVDGNHTLDGSGTGSFSNSLVDLELNTTYYVRAYATNMHGTYYGTEKSFTTNDGSVIITTKDVSNITSTSASCGGNITLSSGNTFPVLSRGVCWGINHGPTLDDSHTSDGAGAGSFNSSITGLSVNTNYYVRAYATNEVGTYYGEEKNFNTTIGLPVVTTNNVTGIAPLSANAGGNVTSDNGFVVTLRGVCWSMIPNPTIDDSHTTNGSGTGQFNSSIDNLQNSTTYHVRAYATNTNGTAYGEDKTFTTTSGEINVTTNSVTGIGNTSATCGGNASVSSDNNLPITARGICWGEIHNPTISGNHSNDGTGTGDFVSSITDLAAGTIYYVRAYATNQLGTYYGEEKTFATLGATPCVELNINSFEYVTNTSVRCTSNATSDGGLPIIERGVCWSTLPSPTINDSHTSNGSGTGYYISTLTSLNANTTYYIRAYVNNLSEISYSEQFILEPDYRIYLSFPRFEYNGHSYVVYPDLDAYIQWSEASVICSNLDFAGYTDWNLPTLNELYYMYLNANTIGGFEHCNYWALDSCENSYAQPGHRYVSFESGGTGCQTSSTYSFRARPIRMEN